MGAAMGKVQTPAGIVFSEKLPILTFKFPLKFYTPLLGKLENVATTAFIVYNRLE